jgi:membrane dipeptidase
MVRPSLGQVASVTVTAHRIRSLLRSAPVIDGHNDLAWEMRSRVGYDLDRLDLATDQAETGLHTDLVRLERGGVGGQFWSVWVPQSLPGSTAVTVTLEQIDFIHQMAARYPDRTALATTADEAEAVWASGRIASLIGAEGGHSIGESLAALRALYAMGVRYLTLTHLNNIRWADSATDAPVLHGLSVFGREVVRECNRLGMMVDLSHVSPDTMNDALDVSTAPAFFSHSSARALCDHPRNVPDAVLRRVRDTNGLVMVTFVPGFLTEPGKQWLDELIRLEDQWTQVDRPDTPRWRESRNAWVAANPPPPATVRDAADHVEHIRDIAGVDAVGIGGDYDGVINTPAGLEDVSTYPNLLVELAERGWSDAELAKLTWGNAMRVLRDTEAAARDAQAQRNPSIATIDQLDGPVTVG